MEAKPIRDFTIDDRIEGFFAVRRREYKDSSRGRFVSLELGDHSGRVQAVVFEPDQFALTELDEGMVVKVRGVVGEYNHRPQLRISRIRLAQDNEYTLENILPHSEQSIEQRRSRILKLSERIEKQYIKQLTMSFWEDEGFFDSFLTAAAGKLWHHACIGGLAEHSANVAELALRVASGYDFLNKDYLVFGGLFHDVGKVDTYSLGTMIDYTNEGRLIGHICLADHWVAERASRIESFPDQLLITLRHMILSHQGTLEFATPVVPQIPEAFVLYYCDEIDSKMGAIDRIRNKHGGRGWSEYVNMLGRFLYFGEDENNEDAES